MYEIYHYDENGELFQVVNVNDTFNLNLYKENQVSTGEEIFVHCTVMGNMLESFSK